MSVPSELGIAKAANVANDDERGTTCLLCRPRMASTIHVEQQQKFSALLHWLTYE